jgi:hypothetical protein
MVCFLLCFMPLVMLCKANQSNTEWNDPITTGKWQDSEKVGYKTNIS